MQRRRLHRLVLAASGAALLVVLGVGGAALRAIGATHTAATTAARADLDALADASRLLALLHQRGFAAEYLLTGDAKFLTELDRARADADRWLAGLTRTAMKPAIAEVTASLVTEYGRYDADRSRSIEKARAGQHDEAVQALVTAMRHSAAVRGLGERLIQLRRDEVIGRLQQADAAARRALFVLVGSVVLGLLGVAATGWLLARRVARPLYELVLRAESAAGGARVEVSATDEIGALGVHVAALARKIEESSAALAAQRARLLQAEKMSALGEMATYLAHEVLNPLAGIKTAMQLLARTQRTPEIAETAAAIDAEIQRVERIARGLMSFARPLQPRTQPVEVGALCERVVDAARGEAARRAVALEVEGGEGRVLRGDPDLLAQAIGNLVLNACQAGGKRVRLVTRATDAGDAGDGGIAFDVIDEGAGLAPEIVGRLFTPFATSKRDGHGLGLPLAQNVALAHGGRLEARANTPGPGMTFTLSLPGPIEEARARPEALAG